MGKIRFKKNNSGMTLVELLVAIAIFASAIVPLLFAFVYSTGYNYRSQSTMQSTGIAQAIIEKCKGANVDSKKVAEMLWNSPSGSIFANTQFEFTSGPTAPGVIPDSPSGTYTYEGVRSTNFGTADDAIDNGIDDRRRYKVVIEVSPATDNLTDFSTIQAVSTQTALFGLADANMLKAEDLVAEAELMDAVSSNISSNSTFTVNGTVNNTVDPGAYFNASDVSNADKGQFTIDRYIIIDVTDSGINVSVKYYTEDTSVYLGEKTGNVAGVSSTLRCTTSISGYSRADDNPFYEINMDNYGHTGGSIFASPASALYFYYFPNFDFGGTLDRVNYTDNFDVVNNMTASAEYYDAAGNTHSTDRFDLYIFKQFDQSLANTPGFPYNGVSSEYKPNVSVTGSGDIYSYLYHNFCYYTKDTGEVLFDPTLAGYMDSCINCDNSKDCYNGTVADSSYNSMDYAGTYRDSSTYESYLLSDYASLPALHDDASNAPSMFPCRYHITVSVYHATNGELIESMEGDFLTW